MKILGGNNYLYENILPEKEGMLYRVSWSSGNADSKIKRVTQANSTPQDLIVYTDCRVSIIVYTDCPVSNIVYTDCPVSIIVYTDCPVSIIVYTDCPVSIIVYTGGSVSIIVS